MGDIREITENPYRLPFDEGTFARIVTIATSAVATISWPNPWCTYSA